MTRYERDRQAIANGSPEAEEILRNRQAEIDQLKREWKTTKYRLRAETAYKEARRMEREYEELEKLI